MNGQGVQLTKKIGNQMGFGMNKKGSKNKTNP